jgi:hypothetical protein
MRRDFLNEFRDVDVRRTGVGARSVIAVEAAVRFDESLVAAKRRMMLGEGIGQSGPPKMNQDSGKR